MATAAIYWATAARAALREVPRRGRGPGAPSVYPRSALWVTRCVSGIFMCINPQNRKRRTTDRPESFETNLSIIGINRMRTSLWCPRLGPPRCSTADRCPYTLLSDYSCDVDSTNVPLKRDLSIDQVGASCSLI